MSKITKIKCPNCLNSMTIVLKENNEGKGCCQKCKSVIIAKQPSKNERIIRIIKV